LAAQQAENANLKSELAKKPKEVVKTETVDKVLAADQSVFFNLGSSKIASKKDLVNLESLANMAKETGAKLKVSGYADSATGSASLNQKLSEARANKVADELVKLGVSRDNLIVEGLGGVSTLKPNSYNRRVIISAAE
jgi:outer membrane protein OmpA-like peptidoglycan-associated protein